MAIIWEYCEVIWTPQQITIRVYSYHLDRAYEGVQDPKDWGTLLALLGADMWEMVGIVPIKPPNHTLYYFKRIFDFFETPTIEAVKIRSELKRRILSRNTKEPSTENQIATTNAPSATEPTKED